MVEYCGNSRHTWSAVKQNFLHFLWLQSVPRSRIQLLVLSFVLLRLAFHCIFSGYCTVLCSQHQKFDLITLLLHEIHCWNPTVHGVQARCPHLQMSAKDSISLHLATEPHQSVDLAPRAFSTCLDRISDRLPYMSLNSRWSSFPITGSHVWNALLQHITSAHSLPVFHNCRKTYLFMHCYSQCSICTRCPCMACFDTITVVTISDKSVRNNSITVRTLSFQILQSLTFTYFYLHKQKQMKQLPNRTAVEASR